MDIVVAMDSALPVVKTKVRSAVSYGRINRYCFLNEKVSLWFSVGLRRTLIVHCVLKWICHIFFYGTLSCIPVNISTILKLHIERNNNNKKF